MKDTMINGSHAGHFTTLLSRKGELFGIVSFFERNNSVMLNCLKQIVVCNSVML